MSRRQRLERAFFARPAREVARDLLGRRLVSRTAGGRVAGSIVESEAYCDGEAPDLACHGDRANQGRPTPRTRVMFGEAGLAYVYFTYGMHWMFNIVTGSAGVANAVLIRALEPTEGLAIMRERRGGDKAILTTGPARLAMALGIGPRHNGADLCAAKAEIWIEPGRPVLDPEVSTGARVGLGTTPEPGLSMPWRFWVSANRHVSPPRR